MRLACIIPLFNFGRSSQIESNHIAAIQRLDESTVDIFTMRVVLDYLHYSKNPFTVLTSSILWQKEAIINQAVNLLRNYYDAIAWIDSGIYLDSNWSHRVMDALEKFDIVQCYSNGIWLDKNGNKQSKRQGYVYNLLRGIQWSPKRHKPSVGGAWAVRSSVFNQFQLYDKAIVGGGDTWMLNGILGIDTPEALVTRHLTKAYKSHVSEWIQNTRKQNFNVGYTEDTYTHLWHMSTKQRQHNTRHKILFKNHYDPNRDVQLSSEGTIDWTQNASPKLIYDVNQFLTKRLSSVKTNRDATQYQPTTKAESEEKNNKEVDVPKQFEQEMFQIQSDKQTSGLKMKEVAGPNNAQPPKKKSGCGCH